MRDILKNDTRIHTYQRGEIILRQGDYGTSAFMVMSGAVRVVLAPDLPASVLGRCAPARKGILKAVAQLWSNAREPESSKHGPASAAVRIRSGERKVFLQDVPRVLNEHKTATLEHGEFFGELAALSRMPRAASIFADSEETKLLEIRWQGLRDLMKFEGEMRAHINKLYRIRALHSVLHEIPIFQNLSEATMAQVIETADFDTYGDYDWSGDYKRLVQSEGARKQEPAIAREGDYPNGVIFIKAGFGRVSQKYGNGERTLNYLGAGHIYGLQEIAHNWRKPEARVPLQYTLRVMGYTNVIRIPTGTMEALVLRTVAKDRLPRSSRRLQKPKPPRSRQERRPKNWR